MKVERKGSAVMMDLHGMRVEEARFRLESYLDHVSPETKEIVLIHGFNGGHALRDMIREDFSHPRVKSILKTLTDGQTRLILK